MMRMHSMYETIHYRDIVHSLDKSVIVVDENFTVLFANLAYFQMFGAREDEIDGFSLFEVCRGVWNNDDLRVLLGAVLPHDVRIQNFLLHETFPIVGRRILSVSASRIFRDGASRGQIVITARDVTKLAKDEEKNADALEKMSTMMTEVQHRVKNNLAAIQSMLRLEMRYQDDEQVTDVLERVSARVESMARLYELLALSNQNGELSLRSYMSQIADAASAVSGSGQTGWSIAVDGDPCPVDVDKAIALGIVVNELVVNAAKYAFDGVDRPGRISLTCRALGDLCQITVADNGCGFDPDTVAPRSTGLGMRLVETYLRSVEGTMTCDSGSAGTTYRIDVPYPENPALKGRGGSLSKINASISRPAASEDLTTPPPAPAVPQDFPLAPAGSRPSATINVA